MKLKLVKRGEVPPDGFRWTDPDTGHKVSTWDERSWLRAIAKHRLDNRLPPIADEDAYDQLCKVLPDGWCLYDTGEKPSWFINTRLTVHDILAGTKVLATFILEGMPLVTQELAASRSAICARCPFNIKIAGCAPCLGLQGVADSIAGGITTPSDASAKSCAICHCSNKAQTRIPIEILAKGVTPEMKERFDTVDYCWKRAELDSLTKS